jgi:hypothetical protein
MKGMEAARKLRIPAGAPGATAEPPAAAAQSLAEQLSNLQSGMGASDIPDDGSAERMAASIAAQAAAAEAAGH